MHSQRSFGKPEKEQGQEEEEEEQEVNAEEEEEEEEEEAVEKEEEEEEEDQQAVAELEKELEAFGRFSEEYFSKFWDFGDANEEGWPRPRLVSVVSPSLSSTLTLRTPSLSWWSQTSVPSESAPSRISSQKSTASSPLARRRALSSKASRSLGESWSNYSRTFVNGVSVSKYTHHFPYTRISVFSIKDPEIVAERL